MAEIDRFASQLLEEAKRFLEKAEADKDPSASDAYLHASLNLAFCSLEAHFNAVAAEIAGHTEFSSAHDHSILLEKEIRLEDGAFVLKGLRMYRFEDRLLYLHRRITGKPLDKTVPWWSELSIANDLRNKLTHPKDVAEIKVANVRRAIQAVIDAIDAVYKAAYGKGLPAAGMGLQSTLNF